MTVLEAELPRIESLCEKYRSLSPPIVGNTIRTRIAGTVIGVYHPDPAKSNARHFEFSDLHEGCHKSKRRFEGRET